MSKKKAPIVPDHRPGMYWLCHHSVIVEWVTDYEARVQYIRAQKKARQRPRRLKWFRRVQGELPAELVEAGRVARKLIDAYDYAANETIDCLCSASQGKGPFDPDRHRKLQDTQRKIYHRALKAEKVYLDLLKRHWSAVMRLFGQECPGCPWDGVKLVFPR